MHRLASAFHTAAPDRRYDGVYALLVINLVVFALDRLLGVREMQLLYLNYKDWHLYQFVTMAFCHGSFAHLSGNVFMIYVFGRLVEEEEGTAGVVATYLLTAVGASILSLLLNRGGGGSIGASGAVFGLFVVATFVKFKPGWRSILETLILGQFAIMQVWNEISHVGGGGNIDRWAHIGGAATGAVVMIWGAKALRDRGMMGK